MTEINPLWNPKRGQPEIYHT